MNQIAKDSFWVEFSFNPVISYEQFISSPSRLLGRQAALTVEINRTCPILFH
jgi:hypothetical protein